MNEKETFLVTFKFSDITREQLDQLLDELFQNAGIIPLSIKKEE